MAAKDDGTTPNAGEAANEEQGKDAKTKKTIEFDKKWLSGLKYATTKAEKVKDEDGKQKIKRTPVERSLTEADVMAWRIDGAEVVLATADGRKHRVKR